MNAATINVVYLSLNIGVFAASLILIYFRSQLGLSSLGPAVITVLSGCSAVIALFRLSGVLPL